MPAAYHKAEGPNTAIAFLYRHRKNGPQSSSYTLMHNTCRVVQAGHMFFLENDRSLL